MTAKCQMEHCRNLIQVSTFKNSQSLPYCDKCIGYMNDAQVSKSSDQYSHRYIPSVNTSPTYAGTKEKCLMCTRLYMNTSRITGKQNTGFCDNCSARYGIHAQSPRDSRSWPTEFTLMAHGIHAQGPRDSRSKRCSIV